MRVVSDFRKEFENLYKKTTDHHEFEWCILVDNSGSMGTKASQSAETLVVLIEVLRKLECRFAIGRFGNAHRQILLKSFKSLFSYDLGEQILESFTFDEGTYPATALANFASKLGWDKPIQKGENKHRMMLMMTDGLTQQEFRDDWNNVTKVNNINLSILLIQDPNAPDKRQFLQDVTTGGCFHILPADKVDELPVALADVMTRQLTFVLKNIQITPKQGPPFKMNIPDKNKEIGQFSEFVSKVKVLDISTSSKEGAGPRPTQMYKVSPPDSVIPFIDVMKPEKKTESNRETFESLVLSLQQYYEMLQTDPKYQTALQNAEKAWTTVETKLTAQIEEYVAVMEDTLFTNNKFTRRRADFRGGSLYLPGLIKAVITDFNYKKIFSSKKTGGKRDYGIVIALDISMSMNGHLADCAIETTVCLIAALNRCGIENYSIVLFGEEVKLIKTEEQQWDSSTMYALMSSVNFENEFATMDADAIEVSLSLLSRSSTHGPKKVFVLTDGYGTCGLSLTKVLADAEEENIEVIGMGIGFDVTFVQSCYKKWITAALPSAVPTALKKLHEHEEMRTEVDWHKYAATLAGSDREVEDILRERSNAFPDLIEQLKGEREIKLEKGGTPSAMTIDLCFCLDSTGSMGQWIDAVKAQMSGIIKGIIPAIKEKYSGLDIRMKIGVVVYRDKGDSQEFDSIRFTEKIDDVMAFLSRQIATGGSDGPENVLGGINLAADWDDWNSKARFLVLVGDAPGHGKDLTDDPGDRYPNGIPGLTAEGVMKKLIDKNIDFLFCRIKQQYTDKMEKTFRKYYESQEPERKITSVDLFKDVKTEIRKYHFIFVLDESGSMTGEWQNLVNAYQNFLRRRSNDQGEEDKLTVVQFDSGSRVTVDTTQLTSQVGKTLPFNGGGTNFNAGLNAAEPYIARTPNGFTPLMIFMSDGADGGRNSDQTMSQIYSRNQSRHFSCNTIGFGSGADVGLLTKIASAGHGQYYPAANGVQLSQVFVQIASGCSAQDSLITRFGEILSSNIVTKVVLDYL